MNQQLDADSFSAYLCLQGLADNTIRAYRALFVRWCDYAEASGRDPLDPDPLAVRAWASQMDGTRSIVAQARATIGHLCRALERPDLSPAIPLPRKPPRAPRGLAKLQASRLHDAAETAGVAGLAVLVGLYTAARRSEIASLAWKRVDFAALELTLTRPKTRDLHTVPLHPVLARHLEARWVPGELWVFPGRNGGHVAPATVWRYVLEVAELAGIGKVTPHQLRHTSITMANEGTGDLRGAQELAGHSDPSQTALYSAVTRDRLRRVVSSLDYSEPGQDSA